MKIKHFITPLITILLFIIGIGESSAQTGTSSEISLGYAPVSQELRLNPEDTFTDKVVFWNLADSEIEYLIIVRGFKQIEDYPGTAMLLSKDMDLNSTTSASNWFYIESKSIIIPPQHNFELDYTIKVPKDIASGEYYAQIFFHTDQKPPTQEAIQTVNNLGGGPTFLIRIGDDFEESMEILEFKTLQKFYERPNLNFSTNISNTGSVHLKPKGVIVLTNMFGQELNTVEFNPSEQALIRDTFATYLTKWESNYLLTDEGKLAFGPITAKLTINYKSETPGYYPTTAETSFWIVQWKLALAILGGIITLVWIIKAMKSPKSTKNYEEVISTKPKVETVEPQPQEDYFIPKTEKGNDEKSTA